MYSLKPATPHPALKSGKLSYLFIILIFCSNYSQIVINTTCLIFNLPQKKFFVNTQKRIFDDYEKFRLRI